MTFRRDFTKTWAPSAIAARMDRWLISIHAPTDIGDNEPHPYCLHCREDWPCAELLRLTGRPPRIGVHHHGNGPRQ